MFDAQPPHDDAPRPALTLFDATSIIVGIIIGSAIYQSCPLIARSVPNTAWMLALWLAGGGLALAGAICYAELAAAYPHAGGDYVYLSRAFGRVVGFWFAWAELWVVRPGSTGFMALVFAEYAVRLIPNGESLRPWLALGAILSLTVVNLFGIGAGKWTQNLLTTVKVAGLLLVVVIGLLRPSAAAEAPAVVAADWPLAMAFIMFAYGGWNDIAFVAAEVHQPQRNILRALIMGTTAVTVIYLLVNLAFLRALGLEGLRTASAPAAEVVGLAFGGVGDRITSVLVCASALGAINGMLLTGARIYYALGQEHTLFRPLGQWSQTWRCPAVSLVVQGLVTAGVVLSFGGNDADAFDRMVRFTVPVFWGFLLLVAVALIRLRSIDPTRTRPFRVPLFPLPPILFGASCAFMVYSSLRYAIENRSAEVLWAIGLMASGVVVALIDRGIERRV